MKKNNDNNIIIGRIGDAYGIKGWSHFLSFTDPIDNAFQYKNWKIETAHDQFTPVKLESYKAHGKGYVIKIPYSNDRDQALLLKGKTIAVTRDTLPALPQGEYYWSDLVGLTVLNTQGETLGIIDHLLETGSNDVIAIKTEKKLILIPYLHSVVKQVDLEKEIIVVDWEELK